MSFGARKSKDQNEAEECNWNILQQSINESKALVYHYDNLISYFKTFDTKH